MHKEDPQLSRNVQRDLRLSSKIKCSGDRYQNSDLLGYVIDGRKVERIGRGEAKGDVSDLGYDL